MMVTGLRERAEPGFEVVAEVLGRGSFLQSQRLDGTISTWLSRLDNYKITTMCLNNCKITIKNGLVIDFPNILHRAKELRCSI